MDLVGISETISDLLPMTVILFGRKHILVPLDAGTTNARQADDLAAIDININFRVSILNFSS
jgi:hypothetical protein